MRNYMDVSRIWREELAAARKLHPLHGVSMILNGRMTRMLGRATYGSQLVELAKAAALGHLTDEELRQVIRHELAHLCAGPGQGHGPEWKRWARALGCTGTAVTPKLAMQNGEALHCATEKRTRHGLVCPSCRHPYGTTAAKARQIRQGLLRSWCACGEQLQLTGQLWKRSEMAEMQKVWESQQA